MPEHLNMSELEILYSTKGFGNNATLYIYRLIFHVYWLHVNKELHSGDCDDTRTTRGRNVSKLWNWIIRDVSTRAHVTQWCFHSCTRHTGPYCTPRQEGVHLKGHHDRDLYGLGCDFHHRAPGGQNHSVLTYWNAVSLQCHRCRYSVTGGAVTRVTTSPWCHESPSWHVTDQRPPLTTVGRDLITPRFLLLLWKKISLVE